MRFCKPVLVLLSTASLFAADDPLQATFARMDAAAANFRGLTANIRKAAHTEVVPDDSVDSGTIVVKRPKPKDLRMVVDIKDPDSKKFCFMNHSAQLYYPKSNTVQIFDVSKKNSAVAEQLLLLGFGSSSSDIQSAFSVKLGGEDTVNGQKAMRLELLPKQKDALPGINKVELWVSEASETSGIALQQKFYQGGDYNVATYSNIKLTPNLPDSAVKCEIPKDAKKEYPTR